MDKREKERKSKVEVVSGTKKQEEDAKKRKSKWDQPGGNSLSSQTLKPAGLVQPSLTNSATGTKGTVISAFGSLPKKPRPWISNIIFHFYIIVIANEQNLFYGFYSFPFFTK